MGNLHRLPGASHKRIIRAALFSGGLSLLFLVSYNACNWITSLRSDVGTLYFGWEKHIPLIPWLIIPYMSIDLFFVTAPFLYKDPKGLLLFAKRISFVIVTASCFFLIMPLKYAFPRVVPDNGMGALFHFLYGFDRPYNLFPSLHIALRTLLADSYSRHAPGSISKWSIHIWFSLIGFSTLFTHQHHMVDIIGGFIVAILSFYFFQEGNQRHNTNHKVGTLYGTLTITVLIVSLLSWPLGIFLWWPATSLLILTCSYFGLVQTVYHKRNGKLTPWTRLPHAFPLLGQHLSLLYYKRQANPWDRIIPGLYIGRCLNEQEAHKLQKQGVTNTLDLTTEFSESGPLTTTGYLNIPVLDLTAPTAKQLAQGICFITEGRKNGTVYVHCKIGYSRTVAMVGAYLLASHKARNTEEALDQIRQARPGVVIRPEVLQALHQYETSAAHSRKPRDCQ